MLASAVSTSDLNITSPQKTIHLKIQQTGASCFLHNRFWASLHVCEKVRRSGRLLYAGFPKSWKPPSSFETTFELKAGEFFIQY